MCILEGCALYESVFWQVVLCINIERVVTLQLGHYEELKWLS